MEMKNICGKIPVDLHEKVRLEIEQTDSSTQKFIQMVIEEHFMKKGEKSMAEVRTVAVQVTEDLFSRLKAVLAKNGMKQKDFLIKLIEEALEKEEAKWKTEQAEVDEPTEEIESDEETEMEETEPEKRIQEEPKAEPDEEAETEETDSEESESEEAETEE